MEKIINFLEESLIIITLLVMFLFTFFGLLGGCMYIIKLIFS